MRNLLKDLKIKKELKRFKEFKKTFKFDYKEVEEKDLKIKKLEEEKSALEIELGKYKARFSNIKAEDNVTTGNIELLKRINLLEKALYNAGIDPSKI